MNLTIIQRTWYVCVLLELLYFYSNCNQIWTPYRYGRGKFNEGVDLWFVKYFTPKLQKNGPVASKFSWLLSMVNTGGKQLVRTRVVRVGAAQCDCMGHDAEVLTRVIGAWVRTKDQRRPIGQGVSRK